MGDDSWLAAHLYYAGNWEDFLTRGVKPFVDKILARKAARQYFFIRYWERGPHIRLRFKGDKETLTHVVKPEVEDFFLRYFRHYPSRREEPAGVKEAPADQRWYPNNSVQFLAYEPEIERYGGLVGLDIAERFFQASSHVTLSVLHECTDWDYERALGTAVQLHLAFAAALAMDLNEAAHFYAAIFARWLPATYLRLSHRLPNEVTKYREYILTTFAQNFAQQRVMLIPYQQKLWRLFVENMEFEPEWLNQWRCDVVEIGRQLRAAQNQQQLVIPGWFQPNPDLNVPIPRQALWAILESYVHMTNNRLGILNHDEAYLGYLMKSGLKALVARHR
jgi:hypothetical protein